MRRVRSIIVLASLVIVAVLPATSVDAGTKQKQKPKPRGFFSVFCGFTHRAPDDPIVAPNAGGGSHSHDFFGNFSTDSTSTADSLQAAGTRCHRGDDLSAYWVPTLTNNGRAVTPRGASVYYLTFVKDAENVKAHPAGLKLIAGDGKATEPQPLHVAQWLCSNHDQAPSQTPRTCPEGELLQLRIFFPDCWNGTDLDSADHKSHFAYSANGACPSTHPVATPRLRMTVTYNTRGGAVALSSGSAWTGHADFFNAWNQSALQKLVATCINGRQHCGGRNSQAENEAAAKKKK